MRRVAKVVGGTGMILCWLVWVTAFMLNTFIREPFQYTYFDIMWGMTGLGFTFFFPVYMWGAWSD